MCARVRVCAVCVTPHPHLVEVVIDGRKVVTEGVGAARYPHVVRVDARGLDRGDQTDVAEDVGVQTHTPLCVCACVRAWVGGCRCVGVCGCGWVDVCVWVGV